MACIYRCIQCGKEERAPQPNRYTTIPTGWSYSTKTETREQEHVCGTPCFLKQVDVETAAGQEFTWYAIYREPKKEKVGEANCKVCKMIRNPPCVFHRKRDETA